jgi:conjugative relaxase-like TrwC/TraI family protein
LHRRSMLLVQARSLSGLGYYFDATYAARVAEAPGGRGEHYGGEVARRLGLEQISGARAGFATLLSGRDPVSLQTLDSGRGRVRHAFFDVVFTSPKSVSLLYALSEPPVRAAVLLAHERARDATLEYLERRAAWVKSPGEDRRSDRADGLCWRAFVHHTSRSGDPHLHSHVLVANLVPSSARGWSPLDSGPFYAERRSAEALYGAALRYELHDMLGVEFRSRTTPGSDVAGFSDQVIDSFSQRTNAIRAALATPGDRCGVSRTARLRGLRPDKVAEPAIDELVAAWRSRARGVGVIPERDVTDVTKRGALRREPPDLVARAVDSAVVGAVAGFGSSFSRSELIVATARALDVGVPVSLFESRVDAVIATARHGVEVADRPERSRRRRFDGRELEGYANARVRSALLAEHGYRGSALRLSAMLDDRALSEAINQAPVVLRAESGRSLLAYYDSIRRLRELAYGVFGREEVVALSSRALSRFEAATGAVGGSRGRGEQSPRLTVILDARRIEVARRAALVADGLSNGGLVVLCDLDASPASTHDLAPTFGHARESVAPTRWYRDGSRAIAFAADLTSAIVEVVSLRARLGPDVVVVADEALAGIIGGDVVATRGRSLLSLGERAQVVVLGDACSVRLPRTVSECTYVMASPLARDAADERALAHALMSGLAPGATVSLRPAERLARGWSMVVDIDRGASEVGLGLGSGQQRSEERRSEGRSEADRADLGPEQQGRLARAGDRDGIRWEPPLPA